MTVPDDDDPVVKALRAAAADEARADEVAQADMLRLAPELAAPPDEITRQRLADRLLGVAPPLQRRVVKAERRFSLRQLFIPLGLAIPLAAGIVFLARPQPVALLPAYQPEISGFVREVRGAEPPPGEPVRLVAGSVLRVNLRPEVTVEGPVVAAAFIAPSRAGAPPSVRPVGISFETSPSGAVAVTARYPEAFDGAEGPSELRVLVLRRALAARAAELASSPQASGPGWQRTSVRLILGDRN
jgi:hypothetical protein